jgi:glycosyltransferase involved in cell wall biosynthesis
MVQDIEWKPLKDKGSINSPLVTVITVVLNGESHLEKAIESVLGQSYKNLEYILIDGGSTDGTLDIIRKYEDRIAYWISEKDNGLYDAMNKGISKASGEIIGILNSDDWYEPEAVEIIVDHFRNHPSGGVYYGLLRVWENEHVQSIQGNTDFLLSKYNISHPTCFVRSDVYKQFGVFDTRYRIDGDYELMLRYRKNKVPFVFIERVLANFRIGGISITQDKKRIFEKLEIQKKYGIIGTPYFILKKLLTILSIFLYKRIS